MKKIILLITVILSTKAYCWGKIGHRIVGEIAEQNLTLKAKQGVRELLGTEDLSRASTWPDEIRSDPNRSYTTPWHYASIPTGKTYFDQKRNKDGDVIEALFRLEDVLRNKKIELTDRREALRFIVHFVGDLHQPLHIGLAEDRGGNTVRVKWFKKETNLHSVWDDELIDYEKLSYTEYAKYLNHFSKKELKDWQDGTYLDWSKESQDLRSFVYEIGKDEVPNLVWEYHFKVKPVYEERLKKAGLRLAFVLNKIFSDTKLSKKEKEERIKVMGNI